MDKCATSFPKTFIYDSDPASDVRWYLERERVGALTDHGHGSVDFSGISFPWGMLAGEEKKGGKHVGGELTK